MIARRLHCVQEVLICTLFVIVGTCLIGIPEPLVLFAGLALICFAVALLAEERDRWHREAYERMLDALLKGTDEQAATSVRDYYGIPKSGKINLTIECEYTGAWSPYEEQV